MLRVQEAGFSIAKKPMIGSYGASSKPIKAFGEKRFDGYSMMTYQ
jgi:hypothetical protein